MKTPKPKLKNLVTLLTLTAALHASADILYVANTLDGSIGKFDLATGADLGVLADSSDGLSWVEGLALDKSGNLYLANSDKNAIVRFGPDGAGTVFATNGVNSPYAIAFGPQGDLFVSNGGDRTIERVSVNGVSSLFASTGSASVPQGLAFDGAGNLYVATWPDRTIQKFTPEGVGTVFATLPWPYDPHGVTFDDQGNLFVGCSQGVQKISPNGTATLYGGTGIMSATGVCFDRSGNLYVADTSASVIYRFTPGGVRSEFARTPHVGHPSFLAIQVSSNSVAAHDVIFYTLNKTQHCWQGDPGQPVERPYISPAGHHYAWHARAQVFFTALANVVSAFVGSAGSPPSEQLFVSSDGLSLEFLDDEPTQETLDASVPDGTYTLQINTVHEGTRSIDMTLGGSAYPPAPHIANFAALQAADPALTNTIVWDTVAGASTSDFIVVGMLDTAGALVFQSPLPNQDGVFSGTNTSAFIPAGLLKRNSSYLGYVIYAKVAQRYTEQYPGVLGLCWYGRITQFPISTAGPAPVGPGLSTTLSGKKLVLSWPTTATGFVLQSRSTLSSSATWEPITNGIATVGSNFVFTNALGSSAGFFRLMKP